MMIKKMRALLLIVPATLAIHASASGNECPPEWAPVGAGMDGWIYALSIFDDGNGSMLYAGGWFTEAGGSPASRIARWNGSSWSPLAGGGVNSAVYDMAVFDDGSGPALYAGGLFSHTGWRSSFGVARWDGAAWSPLGAGVNDVISTLAVFDDGSGPALYAGGSFTEAGGSPADFIARWDGTSWSQVGSGMNGSVFALTVFDDGSGPALYAGGEFTEADGSPAGRIAKWNGASWSALGAGVSGSSVRALTVFDDGNGPALYAGGSFTEAGESPASHIARWDGTSWSALGAGVVAGAVRTLTVFDDGGGPALYAGGDFPGAGGSLVRHIAKWDGESWSALGGGITGTSVRTLEVFDDGSGPALYTGGIFTQAGGNSAIGIARWGSPCTSTPCPADVTGDSSVNLADLNLVLANFGSATPEGDTNNDGVVDLADLNAVLASFGTTCP